jgi:hypothetical protein
MQCTQCMVVPLVHKSRCSGHSADLESKQKRCLSLQVLLYRSGTGTLCIWVDARAPQAHPLMQAQNPLHTGVHGDPQRGRCLKALLALTCTVCAARRGLRASSSGNADRALPPDLSRVHMNTATDVSLFGLRSHRPLSPVDNSNSNVPLAYRLERCQTRHSKTSAPHTRPCQAYPPCSVLYNTPTQHFAIDPSYTPTLCAPSQTQSPQLSPRGHPTFSPNPPSPRSQR